MWQASWVVRVFAILVSPDVDETKVVVSDRIHGVSARIKATVVLVAVDPYPAYKIIRPCGRIEPSIG
jgi:hypothetical protein